METWEWVLIGIFGAGTVLAGLFLLSRIFVRTNRQPVTPSSQAVPTQAMTTYLGRHWFKSSLLVLGLGLTVMLTIWFWPDGKKPSKNKKDSALADSSDGSAMTPTSPRQVVVSLEEIEAWMDQYGPGMRNGWVDNSVLPPSFECHGLKASTNTGEYFYPPVVNTDFMEDSLAVDVHENSSFSDLLTLGMTKEVQIVPTGQMPVMLAILDRSAGEIRKLEVPPSGGLIWLFALQAPIVAGPSRINLQIEPEPPMVKKSVRRAVWREFFDPESQPDGRVKPEASVVGKLPLRITNRGGESAPLKFQIRVRVSKIPEELIETRKLGHMVAMKRLWPSAADLRILPITVGLIGQKKGQSQIIWEDNIRPVQGDGPHLDISSEMLRRSLPDIDQQYESLELIVASHMRCRMDVAVKIND